MNVFTVSLVLTLVVCATASPQGGRGGNSMSECQRHAQREQDKNTRNPGMSGLVPKCEADGSYVSRQCWGQAVGGGQFCVCWDKEGKPINSPSKKNKACECIRQENDIKERTRGTPPPGTYVPQCELDGTFKRTQVHGSTGQSWCVEPERGTMLGSKASPGQAINCS